MRPTSPFIVWVLLLLISALSCSDDKDPEYEIPPPFFDGKDGSRCVSSQDCLGGTCISELSGWKDGYCTTTGCEMRACNNEAAVCVTLLGTTASCFLGCESDDECRPGYYCAEKDEVRFCSARFEDGPARGETGAACETDGDCNRDLACELSFPGGYCLSRGCTTCIGDGVCLEYPRVGEACIDGCTVTAECRAGYLCRPLNGVDICQPSSDPPPVVPFSKTTELLDIRCGGRPLGDGPTGMRWEIDFTVPEGVGAYVVVPLVETGLISPLEITGPGVNINLIDPYKHHNLRALELDQYNVNPIGRYATFAFDWPIQVPYAPKYADLVVPGLHTMRLTTTSSEPCIYVIGGDEGSVLDLNIYLVGIEGLDASSAATDPDLSEVLAMVGTIYGQAGITLGDVRFYEPTKEATERYGVLRNLADIKRLTATGEAHEPTLAGHLSVDVFLVEDILVNNGATAILGISAGLPGAPGMHGNAGNGLVFSVSDLGNDNPFVGFVMAHEIGHFLGLRHTTESVFGTGTAAEELFETTVGAVDPIDDTPECPNLNRQGAACPDYGNLLFPSAPPKGAEIAPTISAGQAQILRLSPLVR